MARSGHWQQCGINGGASFNGDGKCDCNHPKAMAARLHLGLCTEEDAEREKGTLGGAGSR